MEEIYDINFVMPVADFSPYNKRLKDMKKYGILNTENFKIKINLLLGPDDKFADQNISTGWIGDVTVQIIHTPYTTPGQKFAFYYTQITNEEINSAPWHIKIDDDTANDVAAILKDLDDYDPSDRLYLVTEIKCEVENTEEDILRMLNKQEWLNKIEHEYEGCILSYKAILSLKQNPEAQKYLEMRMARSSGYGDQLVGIALKFCKLRPIHPGFMSVYPKVNEFSLFGGKLSHIHFFRGRDLKKEMIFQYFQNLIGNQHKSKRFEKTLLPYNEKILKLANNKKMLLFENNMDVHGLWTATDKDNEIAFSFDDVEGCTIHTYRKPNGVLL